MLLINWLEILCVNKIPKDLLNYLTIAVSLVRSSIRLRIFCHLRVSYFLLVSRLSFVLFLTERNQNNPKPNKNQKAGGIKIKLSEPCSGFEASAALLAGSRGSDQTFYLITEHTAECCAGHWLNKTCRNGMLKYPPL